jgi:hypothetical protein
MPNPAKTSEQNWNDNNRAHTNTWGYLFLYEELNVGFPEAGGIKMSGLAFYNPLASAATREAEALALAARLNRAFLKKSHARFEQGWDEPTAITAQKDILKDKTRTVSELGVKVDEIYSFFGEPV